MAKSAKSAKSDRQAVIDSIRKSQKGSEKRRGYMIVGVCVVVALLIIGAAAYKPLKDAYDLNKLEGIDLAKLGGPASTCQDVITKKASGTQDHVEPGTFIPYEDAPPAFGQHYNQSDTMERKFYSASDRPELGTLVHNLEHGYTILWYDETMAADDAAMTDIRAIASKLAGTSNQRLKFKAVPWTKLDASGAAFPDGQHVALTHWSIGGADAGANGEQVGVWQYCSEPSGAALKTFMLDYPYFDSPEPNAM